MSTKLQRNVRLFCRSANNLIHRTGRVRSTPWSVEEPNAWLKRIRVFKDFLFHDFADNHHAIFASLVTALNQGPLIKIDVFEFEID
jgi:hypothetical protein